MRTLTIKREWAWLIAHGYKTIENRSWSTKYRGPLAILAGKGKDSSARSLCQSLGIELPDEVPAGCIVAVVDLVDCIPEGDALSPMGKDPFAVGPFCWVLASPRLVVPAIACTGRLGLFDVEDARLESFA